MPKIDEDGLFRSTARPAFDFLVTEFGYAGPTDQESELTYDSADGLTAVSVLLVWNQWDIHVTVRRIIDGNWRKFDLVELYKACKLGPAQDIRNQVRGFAQIAEPVGSTAAALRKVMPFLQGSAGAEFLAKRIEQREQEWQRAKEQRFDKGRPIRPDR